MSEPAILQVSACGRCRHSHIEKNGARECRRNPPMVFLLVVTDPLGKPATKPASQWPPVAADHFCGEFSPKPSAMQS